MFFFSSVCILPMYTHNLPARTILDVTLSLGGAFGESVYGLQVRKGSWVALARPGERWPQGVAVRPAPSISRDRSRVPSCDFCDIPLLMLRRG